MAGLAVPASAADNDTKQVEAGTEHSLFVTEGGDLYGCGLITSKQMGNIQQTPDARGTCTTRSQYITNKVDKVATSRFTTGSRISHVLILKENGKLYGMGSNVMYQLSFEEKGLYPGLVYIMDDVVDIAASFRASWAPDTASIRSGPGSLPASPPAPSSTAM